MSDESHGGNPPALRRRRGRMWIWWSGI